MLCSPEMVLTRFAGCQPHSASSATSLTATFARLTATGFENTIMNRRQCPMVSAQQTITYESCWI
ncbi:hypothetical protein K450DRAFT_222652 [Umbelopsis ramanniana AG]|uniref:Uncharacterized protein n=1 Tax=Umbelopsis ramanniana AG TaxID=1314678 RepID=A0AAD5EG56_UMBRA|nr:uncharacterized protein K450DRAFT_222652 [Umbelopsis ramanniana AG]KAI8583236.1 hypothetical protein K450DRAFT_222652 [Umbelopsis ramanniana AG]